MNKRIVVAGLVAGLALFMWEAVAHMMTPLGTAGLKVFPNEPAALAGLTATAAESGLYLFPAPKPDGTPAPAGTPAGLLMFHREGMPELTSGQLGTQFVTDIVAMMLVAFLLAKLGPGAGFGTQFVLVVAMSLFSALRSDLPLWNWYGYPKSFLLAGYCTELVGFALAGLIIPKILQSGAKADAARA